MRYDPLYSIVKLTIQKTYELVSEAYRQKFRSLKKSNEHTYIEFSGQNETYFDRWCLFKEVEFEHDKRRQMILIEKFKECVPDFVKTYLDEKRVDNVHKMSGLADDYVLTRNQEVV